MGFKSPLCHSLAVCPGASNLTSLCLSSPTCKMEVITASNSGYNESVRVKGWDSAWDTVGMGARRSASEAGGNAGVPAPPRSRRDTVPLIDSLCLALCGWGVNFSLSSGRGERRRSLLMFSLFSGIDVCWHRLALSCVCVRVCVYVCACAWCVCVCVCASVGGVSVYV